MTVKSKHVYNILFWGFILFLFTPYGLNSRAKLTQGAIFLKGLVFAPSVKEVDERVALDTYNVRFRGISNATSTDLASLKGKIVFINHWATWCPPCRAEMPSLNKLYKDYGDKIEFIFLTNEPKKTVDKYYKDHEFNLPTYNPVTALPSQINSSSLPATFILDRDGKVILEEFGAADWNSGKVRKLLDDLLVN